MKLRGLKIRRKRHCARARDAVVDDGLGPRRDGLGGPARDQRRTRIFEGALRPCGPHRGKPGTVLVQLFLLMNFWCGRGVQQDALVIDEC